MSNLLTGLLNKLSFAEKKQDTIEINEGTIKQWLVARMARLMKINASEVDSSRTFEQYGLDSIVAVQVAGDLEKFVEQRLSPALLFEHQTIDDLSRYLASELSTSEA